ncbi:MAG: PAS domain-containing protein [Alphaproteobacteria bacterium]|nr:PAS domain-containing protein [Alphaproteobacteria bacterium]
MAADDRKKPLSEIQFDAGLSSDIELVDDAATREHPDFRIARETEAVWRDINPTAMPRRDQVDPLRLGPRLLPHLVILDVLGAGEDFRWRLFGSRHEWEYGRDLTGLSVNDLIAQNPSAAPFRTGAQAVYRRGAPVFFRLTYTSGNITLRSAAGVLLPLSDDGTRVSSILGAADW